MLSSLVAHYRHVVLLSQRAFSDSVPLDIDPITRLPVPTVSADSGPVHCAALFQRQLNFLWARYNQVSDTMDPTSLPLLMIFQRDAKQAQDEANYEDTLSARGFVQMHK